MTKKVVLFIVEGATEKSALSGVFSKIIQSDIIKFLVVGGDITSKRGIISDNIEKELIEKILGGLDTYKYEADDLKEIVHLCDTDGAYVDVKFMKEANIDKFSYTEDFIFAKNISEIEDRNNQKKKNLLKLSGISKKDNGKNVLTINKVKVPYKLYYFSCNLEHVLYDCLENFSGSEKEDFAGNFEDYYIDKIEDFKIIFKNTLPPPEFQNYKKTWLFIGKSNNSLKRYSNFYFYLKEK